MRFQRCRHFFTRSDQDGIQKLAVAVVDRFQQKHQAMVSHGQCCYKTIVFAGIAKEKMREMKENETLINFICKNKDTPTPTPETG